MIEVAVADDQRIDRLRIKSQQFEIVQKSLALLWQI